MYINELRRRGHRERCADEFASMCKAGGRVNATEVIYRSIPSCRDVDPVAAADARGVDISQSE